MLKTADLQKLITGGDTPQSTYDTLILDGIIDPKEVGFCEFYTSVIGGGQYHIDRETQPAEIEASKMQVANLFRNR